MSFLLQLLFGCRHRNTGWPRGRKKLHITCFDCGEELPYRWKDRAAERLIKPPRVTAPLDSGARELERMMR